MRIAGLVYLIVGTLLLGCQGFDGATRPRTEHASPARPVATEASADHKPPLIAGIVMVSGLILVACDSKRNNE